MYRYKIAIRKSTVMEQVMPLLLFFWTSWFAYFRTTASNEAFKAARFIDDTTWSTIFLLAGCFHCLIILKGYETPRRYFLFFLAVFWVAWALLLASTSLASIGIATYSIIALACFLTSKKI